ncbi:GntR family transcriptional regulator [Brachybacterium sp. YJGR34]|uniref:GntR family transcriptional regulator n=1 Tax=Brachybacterium sp. YJGR34 TaxID=2059911 RepID=UPI000E0B5738|nr:GntR family transcriptional regulator [Brachybacterium sp. YJGR34]
MTASDPPENVYEALRTRIVQHDLEPGARISILEESSRLGVSQTPVREALHRLEGDRLVVRAAPRGYEVTRLIDHDALVALFEMRLLLEPWAAREAATERLSNPAPRLREELEVLAALHGSERAVQARRAQHDRRFHQHLMEAAGNPLLPTTFEQLHAHVHVFRLHQVDAEGLTTQEEHTAILEAVAACDPEAAEAAMRAHLMGSFSRLSSSFAADDAAASSVPRVTRARLR